MLARDFVIGLPEGLHMRPAMELCQVAQQYASRILFQKDDKTFDGKSIVHIMSMGAAAGDRLKVVTEGADEAAAMEALSAQLAGLSE